MKYARILIIAFIVTAFCQLAVPASMLIRRETALNKGEALRFRTRPVDPYDAFRGRYVWLDFEQNRGKLADKDRVNRGQKLFARLDVDGEGFARIASLHRDRPSEGRFMPVRARHGGQRDITVRLPFDRFYMEETLAPRAEKAHRSATRSASSNTYAVVRLHRGFPVLEDLVIDDTPIGAYLEESK